MFMWLYGVNRGTSIAQTEVCSGYHFEQKLKIKFFPYSSPFPSYDLPSLMSLFCCCDSSYKMEIIGFNL